MEQLVKVERGLRDVESEIVREDNLLDATCERSRRLLRGRSVRCFSGAAFRLRGLRGGWRRGLRFAGPGWLDYEVNGKSSRATRAARFNSRRVIKTVIRSRSGPSGVGSLAERVLWSNASAVNVFRKSGRQAALYSRHINSVSLMLLHDVENLLVYTIAGVSWWLV